MMRVGVGPDGSGVEESGGPGDEDVTLVGGGGGAADVEGGEGGEGHKGAVVVGGWGVRGS